MQAIIRLLTYFSGYTDERSRTELLKSANDDGTSGEKYNLDLLRWLEEGNLLGDIENCAWFKLQGWRRERNG